MSTDLPTVAIFGGSFNPPHVGHQLAALWVLETQPVSELWFVPCFRHAFDKALAEFSDRLAMCRLAAAALGPRAQVSSIEEELGGASRTAVTLEALQARHPGTAFRLVIGEDILADRSKWHRWDDVERLAPPIVVGRKGCVRSESSELPIELPEVSSTAVRARIAAGQPWDTLVPRAVAGYIRERGLYP